MFIFAADNLKSSLTNGARIGVNLLADLDNKRFIVENLTFLHEAPCGKTLGQRELNADSALAIGHQLGIEEGCLAQILTHLRRSGCLFLDVKTSNATL